MAAGRRAERLDGAVLRDAGRGVRRVRGHARRAGPLRRRDGRGVRRHAGRIPGQDRRAEAVRPAVLPQVRFRGGPGRVAAAEAVPAVPSRKQARVPSVWDPADVARILEAVDRGNPCGKRDYAIILLVTRLGLRSIDVKRLEFSDFDWPGNRLSVAQAKTGRRCWLPLLKDVGWAVIDYVRAGRPASDCPQVFLRHTAPVGPFSDQDHLHQILVKHARAAHVPVSEERRHGMHSLRHTLATRLMEDGTPVEQIADILGHQSVASTGVYLKSSLGLLARCALDPDAPAEGRRHGERRHEPGRRRSRRSPPKNAPSATSTTPRSGSWPGSRRSAAPSSPGWARSPGPPPRHGSPRPAQRGVKPATLQGLAAAGQGTRPLARPPRHRGLRPARRRAAQARPLRPAHLHRPGTGGAVRPDGPLPLQFRGPVPAPGHAGAVPDDLRLRPARLRGPAAAPRRRRRRRRGPADPRRQGRQGPAGARLRAAARTAGRLPGAQWPGSRAGTGSSPAPAPASR